MAWFTCMAGVGGKGNSVIVTCDADFAGIPITCTNGQKTYTKVCPSFSPYEVTFSGLVAGTWTISATVDGVVYSTTAIVTDITAVLSYGFNWQMWVDSSSSLHSEDYNDLSDLLSDEAAIRQLFTEHAPTDYAASTATVTPDLATVLNNDLCAKWINLRDYALDTLYANPLIAAAMDSADKYFYGEWGIVDDTTTPPTWGPKGNVPVMTSNSAPYGEASASTVYGSGYEAYKAFDGNDNTQWATTTSGANNAYLRYKFTNPTCVKKVSFIPQYNNGLRVKTFSVKASNDGTNWTTLKEITTLENSQGIRNYEYDINNDNYYLYYELADLTSYSEGVEIRTLQFYGRELKVSVPTMTTNTTPYGEVGASGDSSNAYRVFDGIDTVSGSWSSDNNATNNRLYYKFTSPTCVKRLEMHYIYAQSLGDLSFKVQVSDDGSNWSDIPSSDFTISFVDTALKKISLNVENNEYHLYWAIFTPNKIFVSGSGQIYITTLQFYGLDYSEKEFEEGTTKKWLYDHGVELETLTYYGGASNIGEVVNCPNTAGSGAKKLIDLTPYSLFRCKVPFATLQSRVNGYAGLIIRNAAETSDLANVIFAQTYLPNNCGLDISSINQESMVYVCNLVNVEINTTQYSEIWLE